MHYRENSDLPPDIKESLPEEAQRIYRETFNRNFPASRAGIRHNSEGIAHEAAWRAVRQLYEWSGGKWLKKQEG